MNSTLKPNTLLDKRYRILSHIGEGGYGTVYKARDQHQHNRLVAIKEINMSTLNAQEKIEVTDTFNREIMLLSSLMHKNLPHIYDHFTDPEHWYIVMDYIEGETLEDRLAHSPEHRLPIQQVIKIGMELCDVLSYLHHQNPAIIFRDVKPGNIMLTYWGQIYLIDFGIARRYRAGKLRDTGPLGSPGYAAPEQYGRAQTTPQTDIYGLGATLQTLLTGREPLELRTQGWPSDVYIPWELQALISQMMDYDPGQRPESLDEVKKVLARYLPSRQYLAILPYIMLGSLSQVSFITSFSLISYFYLALALTIPYCLYRVIRTFYTVPTHRLSLKAIILIIRYQFPSAFLVCSLLIESITLLFGLLTYPEQPAEHTLYFWIMASLFFGATARFLFTWLKQWYAAYRVQRSSAAQSHILPPQHIQKRF